jgi:hypothetical protein
VHLFIINISGSRGFPSIYFIFNYDVLRSQLITPNASAPLCGISSSSESAERPSRRPPAGCQDRRETQTPTCHKRDSISTAGKRQQRIQQQKSVFLCNGQNRRNWAKTKKMAIPL